MAPSWSSLGFAVRSRLWSWAREENGSLTGSSFLVTGGTSGIGREAARELARRGAGVGIVGRDLERAEAVGEEISSDAGSGRIWAAGADIGSLGAVHELASLVKARVERLSGIVHCAGALYSRYEETSDGIERTVAVHVVGPHLLTALLLDRLGAAGTSNVVWMSSGGMYASRLNVKRIQERQGYRGTTAYAHAKRAQVVLAGRWAAIAGARGIGFFAMHPGWVDTPALREGLPSFYRAARPFLRRPVEGADTAVWLATGAAPLGSPTGMWLDRRARGEHKVPWTRSLPGDPDRLWEWCQLASGLSSSALPGTR